MFGGSSKELASNTCLESGRSLTVSVRPTTFWAGQDFCVEVSSMSEEQVVGQKVRRTAAEIEQIVSEFQSSGMSRSQFCRVRGLTFGVLNRYLMRMRGAAKSSANGDGLVAVEWGGKKPSVERANGCGLSVVLGSGREIAVNTGFDAATLLRLVEVLERL